MRSLRALMVFCVLVALRTFSVALFRQETRWVQEPQGDLKQVFRIVAILNHTSLYEALLSGQVPLRFLWRMANHCTIPIADVTLKRPIVGLFWHMVAGNIVSVTRERDHTWEQVVQSLDDPESMVIILPEGRMKRAGGLDKHGKHMRVRGGIADLIRGIPDGTLLLAYSQGLHHIQVPGQKGLPKFFQPVRLRFETLDLESYRAELMEGLAEDDVLAFRKRVIADLTERRDRYCTSDIGGLDEPESWK
ncbi:MAG: hypothetical protein AAGN66_24040 [Acidobacteriota bacterium]